MKDVAKISYIKNNKKAQTRAWLRLLCPFLFLLWFGNASFSSLFAFEQPGKPVIERFVIFGDSLSDTGNMLTMSRGFMPSPYNYWQGRLADGFSWVDYLAEAFDTTASEQEFIVNNSVLGATAYSYSFAARLSPFKHLFSCPEPFPNFRNLVRKTIASTMVDLDWLFANFEKHNQFRPSDLVMIWIGSNDLLWVGEFYDPRIDVKTVAMNAAIKIKEKVEYLLQKGVKNIIITGIPDLDVTPRFRTNPRKAEQLKYYNEVLSQYVNEIRKFSPNVYFADANYFLKEYIIPNYRALGFENYMESGTSKSVSHLVISVAPPMLGKYRDFGIYNQGSDTHVFWDDVHLTTLAHSIVSALYLKYFIKPNFNIKDSSSKCRYVEVHNSGAYLLRISSNTSGEECGKIHKTLLPRTKALFSIQEGTDLTLNAFLGRTAVIPIGSRANMLYRAHAPRSLRTMIPSFEQITCTGTTIIGFKCEKMED